MMYVKLKQDFKKGDLVPLHNDSIYVYCEGCNKYEKISDTSRVAFGTTSFEEINACEHCANEIEEEQYEEYLKKILYKLGGFGPNVKLMIKKEKREATSDELLEHILRSYNR